MARPKHLIGQGFLNSGLCVLDQLVMLMAKLRQQEAAQVKSRDLTQCFVLLHNASTVLIKGEKLSETIVSTGMDHLNTTNPKFPRPPEGRSLSSVDPHSANFLHPIKNGPLTASDLAPGSRREVWWRCPVGHEWFHRVKTQTQRVAHHSCYYCYCPSAGSGVNAKHYQRVAKSKPLVISHPEVACWWGDRNLRVKSAPANPTEVSANTNKTVWWVCRCGKEFRCEISQMATGQVPCPDCGTLPSVTDQRIPTPATAAELAAHKASYEGKGIKAKVSREEQEMRDHLISHPALEVPEQSMTSPTVLDVLSGRHNTPAEVDGIATHKKTGHTIVFEYDGAYWHQNPKGRTTDVMKSQALLDAGYYVVRIEPSEPPKYLDVKDPASPRFARVVGQDLNVCLDYALRRLGL